MLANFTFGGTPESLVKSAAIPSAPDQVLTGSIIPNILVVDDDSAVRNLLVGLYESSGYTVIAVRSGEEAMSILEQGTIDFVITEISLPGIKGTELIANMQESCPDVPVIAITGSTNIDTAINVLKLGVADFMIKPFDPGAVHEATRAALEKAKVYMEIRHLRRGLRNGLEFAGMLSKTPEMHRIFEIVRMVSHTEMTVSI